MTSTMSAALRSSARTESVMSRSLMAWRFRSAPRSREGEWGSGRVGENWRLPPLPPSPPHPPGFSLLQLHDRRPIAPFPRIGGEEARNTRVPAEMFAQPLPQLSGAVPVDHPKPARAGEHGLVELLLYLRDRLVQAVPDDVDFASQRGEGFGTRGRGDTGVGRWHRGEWFEVGAVDAHSLPGDIEPCSFPFE